MRCLLLLLLLDLPSNLLRSADTARQGTWQLVVVISTAAYHNITAGSHA
jgi:hypothetical protein